MNKPGLISPADYGYMEENPYGDPNFDPEKNKKIIADSIKRYERNRRSKKREYQESIRYRSAAIATYLESVKQGKGGDIKKYFGNEELARLRGQEVLNALKMNPEIVKKLKERLDKKSIYKPL